MKLGFYPGEGNWRRMENEEQTFFVCVAENKAVCLLCWRRNRL